MKLFKQVCIICGNDSKLDSRGYYCKTCGKKSCISELRSRISKKLVKDKPHIRPFVYSG